MKSVARFALLAVAALVAGCERVRVPSEDGGAQSLEVGAPGLPAFVRIDPRLTVAHSGERRIEITTSQGGSHTYRELIQTDGRGRFSIRPLELLDAGSLDGGGFELLQLAREGFLFRYRDFAVRDPRLFARNWIVVQHPGTELVAGRTCERYRVERRTDAANAYELWVDPASGLVLASEQYEANGQRVVAMRYESVDYAPNLAGAIWHVPTNLEEALDPTLPLQEQVEHRILVPRLLPDGYAPHEAATVGDGTGKRWLKLTYGDGVESLFFLQALAPIPSSPSGKIARAEAPSNPSRLPVATSSVVVFRVGAALAVQGFVDGFQLMAIGTVAEAELLDLIESALP